MTSSSPDSRLGANPLIGSPLRFAATLIVALVATAPGFQGAVIEGQSLPAALARFLTAFVVLWVAGGVASVVLQRDEVSAEAIEMSDTVPGSTGLDH